MPPTLEVVFALPDGTEETKVFESRPLGMEFVQRQPIVVTKVIGEASKIGVHKGWQIKTIGGEPIEALEFDEAFELFKKATQPLFQELILRDCPYRTPNVTDLGTKVGPVEPAEVVPFLKRYGYSAASGESWSSEPRPEISLGVINGHREKGDPTLHTWYALHGRLALAGSKPWRWQVERRLAHMRSLLHDPIKKELGKEYDRHFEGHHFAHHAGPPGTTSRLEGWLAALARIINAGQISPALVAATLRFLEAPELTEQGQAPADKEEMREGAARQSVGATSPTAGLHHDAEAFPDDKTEDGEAGLRDEEAGEGLEEPVEGWEEGEAHMSL